jgi:aldose 1-epimerase
MRIEYAPFGATREGQKVDLFTLDNERGVIVKITNFGGRVTEIHAPDRHGQSSSIVLGFDRLEPYLNNNPFFGAIVGRFANRIAGGRFLLDGVQHQILKNDGPNTLHGGPHGFDKVVWRASPSNPNGTPTLRLAYVSPDGDQGFPGNCEVRVTYSLTDRDELRIDYVATTDKPTVINLSNHSYFNLAGAGSATILQHHAHFNADRYTPVKESLIPTGQIAPVRATPLDFTIPRLIGERISDFPNGYDHNLILTTTRQAQGFTPAARVTDESSGRGLEVFTDQPAVQFYTGGFLDNSIKGIGGSYPRFGAFCLETQHYPDSPNHPNFPSTILRPGQTFSSTTVYRFFTL